MDTTSGYMRIDPDSQAGTDLQITMDSTWRFHPAVPSEISISMYGSAPNITKADGEFEVLFAVNNQQYFSIVIRLEDKTAWKIYPSQNSPLAFNKSITSDIIFESAPARWNRVSDDDN